MKYYKIDDAIIIENQETEPKFNNEVIPCEIISEERSESSFFGIPFLDNYLNSFFNIFSREDNDFEDYLDTPKADRPTNAEIVETMESKVQEIQYLYFQIF